MLHRIENLFTRPKDCWPITKRHDCVPPSSVLPSPHLKSLDAPKRAFLQRHLCHFLNFPFSAMPPGSGWIVTGKGRYPPHPVSRYYALANPEDSVSS